MKCGTSASATDILTPPRREEGKNGLRLSARSLQSSLMLPVLSVLFYGMAYCLAPAYFYFPLNCIMEYGILPTLYMKSDSCQSSHAFESKTFYER